MSCPKITNASRGIHTRISKPEDIPPFYVRRHLVPNIHGIVIYVYIYDFVFIQQAVLLPKRVADY
jgi:hypothetical protein